jgi:hypothetical protein
MKNLISYNLETYLRDKYNFLFNFDRDKYADEYIKISFKEVLNLVN